jgi:hypothetical protein
MSKIQITSEQKARGEEIAKELRELLGIKTPEKQVL